jgi:cytochrome c5
MTLNQDVLYFARQFAWRIQCYRRGANMKHVGPLTLGCLVLAASAAIAQMQDSAQKNQKPANPPETRDRSNASRGQQVFNENCSRCHNTPEGFSSHISGTISKHMRVRAGLSEADYKELLHFLNP